MTYFEDELEDAVTSGNVGFLERYLGKGMDANYVFCCRDKLDRFGKTLLESAVLFDQTVIVKKLIDKKCDPNLSYIVDIKDFEYCYKQNKRKNRLKHTCFYRCIVQRQTEIVKLLVNGGFDVNLYDERKCTSLWHAVDLDNYEMAKAICSSKRCDVDAPDCSLLRPLHVAAMHGNTKIVSMLLKKRAEVDSTQLRGSTSLILSCRSGCYPTSRLLLLNGADPNAVGYNGHTVLSTAISWCSSWRLPEMLIEAGAYVDIYLLKKCKEEKIILFKQQTELFDLLKRLAMNPRPLRLTCCVLIRKFLMKSPSNLKLLDRVNALPLPLPLKEFLLLSHI